MGKYTRPGRQSEIPPPHGAQEQTGEKGVEIPAKAQKEKSVPGDLDVNCLRFRDPGDTLGSDPRMRVTQGAKKDAENSKKDQNIVYTKKLRAGSHWDSEDIQKRH